MSKIPVYFMPGLAASPIIFENIKLPEEDFEMYFLEWFQSTSFLCLRLGMEQDATASKIKRQERSIVIKI